MWSLILVSIEQHCGVQDDPINAIDAVLMHYQWSINATPMLLRDALLIGPGNQ
jgi:hypothetical protein